MELRRRPVADNIRAMLKNLLFLILVLLLAGCASDKKKADPSKYDSESQDNKFFSHGWFRSNEHQEEMGLDD